MADSTDRAELTYTFGEFIPAETVYKEYYIGCSDAFITPISSWEEFARRMREGGYRGKVPDAAPSPIAPWLSENDFFPEKRLDVSIVRNDRYCPPFWHRLEFIKIVYIAKGSAEFFVNDSVTVMREGELCLVPPGVRNATFSHSDGDIVINVIVKRSTFERSFSSLLTESSPLSDYFLRMLYRKNGDYVLFFRKKGEEDLTGLILQLYRELSLGASASNIMLKSYLMLLFGNMLRHYAPEDDPSAGGRSCDI